jgi:hypothetical protein
VSFLSGTTLAPRLPRGSPLAGKRLRKEGGGNLLCEPTHPPQLGVSSAYNPGASNTSLQIIINSHATSALVDSGATDNFVHPRILSAGTPIRRQLDNHVLLAGEGKEMEIVGGCDLHFVVADLSVNTSFLVSPGLRFDVVLGRRWLKKYQVIHDHNFDCLYLGRDWRRRVFLSQAPRKKLPGHNIAWEKVQHGLPAEHQAEFRRLLARHADIFDDSGPLQHTRFIKHDIVVTDSKPFRLPPYQYSAAKKKAIQEQVKEILASGVIEASSSPYSSPIVMAPKKERKFRFCVDFRRLNGITEDSSQPLPVIHEVLKDLVEATIFSTLDLRSGYWQIPLTNRAKKYTAFVTPDDGQYAFKVAPFGLPGVGRTCTQFVGQEILVRKCCMHYHDDIFVYSKNWTVHLQHLARQMGRTRQKEKQSARTVPPKTLRAKGDKRSRRETREDFTRKEKYMRFAASRRKEMMTQSPKNKGQCSSVGPAQPKGKLRPIYTSRIIS